MDVVIYGNFSWYINYVNDICNIILKIMYVNYEFCIKFLVFCDIKVGEELFFNYGDNFFNLIKKFVEL